IPSTVAPFELPAASFAVPWTDWFAPSPSVVGPGHVSMPDSASAHVNVTVTSVLFHPFPFGAGAAWPEMVGAVRSTFTVAGSDALLPARSTAVPGTGCPAPSVVTVRGGVQLSIPDTASSHWNVTVTSVLFHPNWLASGSVVCVMVGGVLSILTWIVWAASTLPALSSLQYDRANSPSAEKCTVVPVWSLPPSTVKWVALTPESASLADRLTSTSTVFQAPGAAAVVVGAVVSILTAGLVAVVVLPALSLTDVVAARPTPSPGMMLSGGVAVGPESASEAVQWIETFWWYQPLPFGLVVGAPLRVGATLSMLTFAIVAWPVLSALSVAAPVTDCPAPLEVRVD